MKFREKRKTSPLAVFAMCVMLFFVIMFYSGVAGSYISGQPKTKFDEKMISECEREFCLEFDGSFTPVQYAHSGMRDSVYRLWIKDIPAPEVFMEEHYSDMYEFYGEGGVLPDMPESLADYSCESFCVLKLPEKTDNTVKIHFYKNSAENYAARLEKAYS